MTDPRERLMDHALAELFGAREETDVSARVLERLERGERIELEFEPERGAEVAPARPRLRLVPLIAAAAALALATWLLVFAGGEEPFATTSAPVAVLDSTGAPLGEANAFAAGVLVAVDVPVELVRGDDVYALASRAVVGVGADAADLHYGGLGLIAGDVPRGLRTSWAGIEPAPGTRLDADVRVDGPPGALARIAPADVAAALVRRSDPPPRILTVSVLEGSAELVVGDVRMPIRAGESVLVTSGGRVLSPLTEADEVELVELFALTEVPIDAGPWFFGSAPFAKLLDATHALGRALHERPHGWSALLGTSRQRWERRHENEFDAALLLMILVMDEAPASLELAREFWLEDPGAFEDDLVIGFAERGAFEFEREVRAIVAANVDKYRSESSMLAAAWLALERDPVGIEFAESRLPELDADVRCGTYPLAASMALEFAGRAGTWGATRELARKHVEQTLDEGKFEYARMIAITVGWFDDQLERDEPPRLALVQFRVSQHMIERDGDLQTSDAIRAFVADW